MCLRLGTKPPSELITQYIGNLLYFTPIRMGSSTRVTGSAMWSQQNWVCSLSSACLVYTAPPGPRGEHHIKNPYYALGKKITFSNKVCIPIIHICPCISFSSSQNSDWIFPWDLLGNSSSRVLCFTFSYSVVSFVFISGLLSDSIYSKPLTAVSAFSILLKLSDPGVCTVVVPDPTVH